MATNRPLVIQEAPKPAGVDPGSPAAKVEEGTKQWAREIANALRALYSQVQNISGSVSTESVASDSNTRDTVSTTPSGPAGGDLTGDYPDPTLVQIGPALGPFGSQTHVPIIARDSKGRVSSLTYAQIGVIVNNRVDLRAVGTLAAGVIVEERGYAVAGDGGGGRWLVVRGDTTTIDNDGTLIVPGGVYGSVSTDMSLKRCDALFNNGNKNCTVMNVRWFGAVGGFADCTTSVSRAFAALAVGVSLPGGALYFPSGQYGFQKKLTLDSAGFQVDVFGDGASSQLVFAFPNGTNVATNDCMIQFKNFPSGSFIGRFSVSNPPVFANMPYPQSILRFTGGGEYEVASISFQNVMTDGNTSVITYVRNTPATQGPAGAMWIESGTSVTVHHINASGFGTMIYVGGVSQPSVMIHHCWLKQNSYAVAGAFANGVMGVRPTFWVEQADSALISEIFVENGGPYRSFPGSTITGGANFVIDTIVNHNFQPGDYVVVNGATGNVAYNHKWRINAVTAHTVTIATAMVGNETGLYVTSLFACCMFGGGLNAGGGGVTESTIKGIYTNTGGRLIEGSVGLYFAARKNAAGGTYFAAGLVVSDVFSDFGESTLFLHGQPQAGYSLSAVLCSNIRANGGPRSPFGGIRVEIGDNVTINSPYMQAALTAFAGALIIPNPGVGLWPYTPITAVAIDDGGGDNPSLIGVSDIHICGGILQSVNDTVGIGALVSCALSVSGTRIQNIRCVGSGIDLINTNSTPLSLLNGATRSGTVGGVIRELIHVDFWQGRSATAYPSAAQALPNGVATYLTQFDTQVVNDDGQWNVGFQDRLTVTQPVRRIRIHANVTFAAAPGANAFVQVVKNGGANIHGTMSWGGGPYASIVTPPIEVVPGDFFSLLCLQNTGGPFNVNGGFIYTNISMEVVD